MGVERDVHVRAQHFAVLRWLLGGDLGQQHREAARRVQRLGVGKAVRGLKFYVPRRQALDDTIKQRLRDSVRTRRM